MAVEPTEVKTILLTGPVTLYEVAAVRESLRTALAEGKPLRIDLGDSGPWDLAGLQLLVSCVKTARRSEQDAAPGQCPEGLRGHRRAIGIGGLARDRAGVMTG